MDDGGESGSRERRGAARRDPGRRVSMALGVTGAIHRRPEPAEAPAARVQPPDGLEREPIGRGAPDGRDRTAYHRGHDQKPGRDRREHGDPSERHILGQTQWVC